MSERDLNTSRTTVFGDVERGTDCRVCGREVTDGRSKHCSDRCKDIADAVLRMLNWGGVKERIKDRDDYTCQHCGVDAQRHRRAKRHVEDRIWELTKDLKHDRKGYDPRYTRSRAELKDRYNYEDIPYIPLEVDHIERVADGGAIFDESNLQTLCTDCHQDKTASENSNGQSHPEDLETLTLDDYLELGAAENG